MRTHINRRHLFILLYIDVPITLNVCHGLFDLNRLRRAVMNGNKRKFQNKNYRSPVGFESATFRVASWRLEPLSHHSDRWWALFKSLYRIKAHELNQHVKIHVPNWFYRIGSNRTLSLNIAPKGEATRVSSPEAKTLAYIALLVWFTKKPSFTTSTAGRCT